MKQINKLLIALVIIGTLSPNITTATETNKPTCDTVLKACDRALTDQIKLNHEQQGLIKAQEDLVITQRDKINLLEAENKSLFRSPWLWGAVGFGLGVYLMKK